MTAACVCRSPSSRLAVLLLFLLGLGLEAGCASYRERSRKEATLDALEAAERAAVDAVAAAAAARCVTIRPSDTTIGSGAIISEDGWILTAQHVVRGHKAVSVTLPDGLAYEGRVIAESLGNDYALLKVDARGLPFFNLGRRPRIGDRVVAVGTPAKWQGQNASTGVVIYPRVRIPGEDGAYYYDAIFHSAPIFKGDSGGPLVDMRGDLVGIHGGFASENASVAPAIAEIVKRLPNGGRLAGTDFAVSGDPDAFPIPWPAQRPRDFAESAAWTLESVEETLVAVYAPGDRASVRDLLERIRARYVAARTGDPRRDDELVRAMLSEIFRELEARKNVRAGGAVAAAPSSSNAGGRRDPRRRGGRAARGTSRRGSRSPPRRRGATRPLSPCPPLRRRAPATAAP